MEPSQTHAANSALQTIAVLRERIQNGWLEGVGGEVCSGLKSSRTEPLRAEGGRAPLTTSTPQGGISVAGMISHASGPSAGEQRWAPASLASGSPARRVTPGRRDLGNRATLLKSEANWVSSSVQGTECVQSLLPRLEGNMYIDAHQ